MKYNLMNYEGCGRCKHAMKCKDSLESKKGKITFLKSERWDNCEGRMVVVFRKGTVVEGDIKVDKDNNVFCAAAESPIYTGIDDFICLIDEDGTPVVEIESID